MPNDHIVAYSEGILLIMLSVLMLILCIVGIFANRSRYKFERYDFAFTLWVLRGQKGKRPSPEDF